jgi:hypothetical protein
MALIDSGSALMAGTFGTKAMSVFHEMNGTSMGMLNSVRQLMAAGLVVISELMFHGTIVPVTQIIFALAVTCSVAYAIVCYGDAKKLRAN